VTFVPSLSLPIVAPSRRKWSDLTQKKTIAEPRLRCSGEGRYSSYGDSLSSLGIEPHLLVPEAGPTNWS
jgi:hypothetical protein